MYFSKKKNKQQLKKPSVSYLCTCELCTSMSFFCSKSNTSVSKTLSLAQGVTIDMLFYFCSSNGYLLLFSSSKLIFLFWHLVYLSLIWFLFTNQFFFLVLLFPISFRFCVLSSFSVNHPFSSPYYSLSNPFSWYFLLFLFGLTCRLIKLQMLFPLKQIYRIDITWYMKSPNISTVKRSLHNLIKD